MILKKYTFFLLLIISTGGVALSDQIDTEWSKVSSDEGITIFSKVQSGRLMPLLRAIGQIEGSLFHVMAVILDNESSSEWVPNCTESHKIQDLDHGGALVYSVTNSPWPVADRDSIVETHRAIIQRGSKYKISMQARPNVIPVVKGRVRIPYSEIYFLLEKVDDKTTKVEYGLDVDPGGMLPDWLIRSTIDNTLKATIRGLERQVARTKGKYVSQADQFSQELE
tara:strand:+ start:4572 stop:5243 length:672 start_codon:yes stop_codon:yes gene_type:complete